MNKEILELQMNRNAKITEEYIKKVYENDEDIQTLLNAEQYSLYAGGKRIRPTLCLEFCKLFQGDELAALPFASAVEMMHTSSLIHDDLPCMDNDDLRRGKPTNHKVFGETMALLAGDSLMVGSFEMAASNTRVSADIVRKAVAYFASSAGRLGMIGGQVMDLEGEHKKLTLDQLLRLHSMKTGALITASCVMGALAAEIDFSNPIMQDVITYAENVGLVFQIVDDVLDKTGSVEKLGKNVGVDKEHEKNTFMSFYTTEEAMFYAKKLTEEAIEAIQKYAGHDTLVTLAKWLLERDH